MSVRILQGDVRDMLATLEDESVHCVVTSPPYWGLRDYGTAKWEGGDGACDHLAPGSPRRNSSGGFNGSTGRGDQPSTKAVMKQYAVKCGKCGAQRIDRQLGMEPTMGEHIDTMVAVFREVRRVLRKDGTVWLNYGDCYATAPNGRSAADTKAASNDDRTFRDKPFSTVGPICDPNYRKRTTGGIHAERRDDSGARVVAGGYLKPKDLCMIPNRLAIALQDDGWWVRSEIIWAKPNPMPESVTDRPATAHEKIWLLTKSARYWYDAEAVRRPIAPGSIDRYAQDIDSQEGSHRANGGAKTNGTMKAVGGPRKSANMLATPRNDGDRWRQVDGGVAARGQANLRNVWTIPTKGFSGAHYATFPPDLIVPCIKAGCPKGGTVLDPFIGSGTTAMVADRLGRSCIGIDLNPANVEMATYRITDDAGMFAEVS